MSDEREKIKHGERLHQKETKIQRQLQLAKNYGYHKLSSAMSKLPFMLQPHRHHKTKILNCGDPKCAMCGNPRKFFSEETVQERRHKQTKYYKDSNEI